MVQTCIICFSWRFIVHVPVRFPFTEPCGMCYFVHESFKQTGRKMTPQNLIFRFFPSSGGNRTCTARQEVLKVSIWDQLNRFKVVQDLWTLSSKNQVKKGCRFQHGKDHVFSNKMFQAFFRANCKCWEWIQMKDRPPGGTKELLGDSETDGVFCWFSRRPCDLTTWVWLEYCKHVHTYMHT